MYFNSLPKEAVQQARRVHSSCCSTNRASEMEYRPPWAPAGTAAGAEGRQAQQLGQKVGRHISRGRHRGKAPVPCKIAPQGGGKYT